jgi:hypothetical protein
MAIRPRGPQPGWRPTAPRPAGILADLVARYRQHQQEGTLPRGGRGIFYDLRPNGMGNGVTYRKPDSAHPLTGFGPMEAHPAAVQEVLVMARRAGIIPENWVADTRAPAPLVERYDDSAASEADVIARWVENAADAFRLDPQLYQPRYIELWCEAEDLAPRLARISEPYGVPVYSGGGFDGLKGKRSVADRAAGRDMPTLILHVGDRDPHGEMIYNAVKEDAEAWALDAGCWELRFERLALTADQAEEHGLLDADGKAEADALPVAVLDAIVTDRLDELFDPDGRDQMAEDESEQRAALPAAIRAALAGVLGDE